MIQTLTIALLCLLLSTPAPASGQDDLVALERLAEASFAEDDLDVAIALYRQLADRHTALQEKTRVLMIVAYLEHSAGRQNQAVETVRDALLVDPKYTFDSELYDDAMREVFYEGQKLAFETRTSRAQEFNREGNARFRAGDYPGARQSFEAALGYQPDYPKALYNLALVHLNTQNGEEAEAGFQKLLALGDRVEVSLRTLARINLGHLYTQRSLYLEAEEILLQAIEDDPSNAKVWSILGAAQRQLGKQSEAAEAARRAYDLQPDNPEAMGHLALAYIDAEDWARAIQVLEQATAAERDNANMWLHLGRARQGLAAQGQGTTSEAIAAFENAIRLDPQDQGGWASNAAVHLAQLYYETRAYSQAIEQAERALAWRQDLVNAHVFSGLASESLGDLASARRSLETARTLDPTRADTHFNLGSIYYQLGLYNEAEEALERTLAISSDFPKAQENLGAVREARERPPVITPPPGRRGKIPLIRQKPRLGVRFADIDYAAIGLRGAMVERVESGGAAARAGVRKNDLILKIDGRDVASVDQLKEYVASRNPGTRVSLTILRANVPTRIDVLLK
ncbi:MAG: tetratricopeptide repeat protein [Acidobacteriota bacterium]